MINILNVSTGDRKRILRNGRKVTLASRVNVHFGRIGTAGFSTYSYSTVFVFVLPDGGHAESRIVSHRLSIVHEQLLKKNPLPVQHADKKQNATRNPVARTVGKLIGGARLKKILYATLVYNEEHVHVKQNNNKLNGRHYCL